MMRKAPAILSLLLALTFAVPLASQASEGASCSKAGATKKVAGKTLTCKKSGKKLIWSAAKTKATPKPSPSKVEVAFAYNAREGAGCYIKDERAQTKSGPLICDGTWKLVSKENDNVESRAFRNVLDTYLAQSEGDLSLIWRIDPITPAWRDQVKDGMVAGARLWGTSPKGSDPRYVYVSPSGDWIIERAKEDGLLRKDSTREYQSNCNAGIVGDDFGKQSYWFYKYSGPQCLNSIGFYQVGAHEYTHYAQEALSKRGWEKTTRVPWLDEGLASFIGGALGPYGANRSDLRNLWSADAAGVSRDLKFFSAGIDSVYRDVRWQDVYPMGAIAAEGMVALIGIEGVGNIYRELATPGTTYEVAFRKATGMTNSTWMELLQGYFDSVRNKEPWSLAKLESEYAARR